MLLENEDCCNLSTEVFRFLLSGFFTWTLFQESEGRNCVAATQHSVQRDQRGTLNSHCFRVPWEQVWQTCFLKSAEAVGWW